jgi:hypothetical protein
MNSRGRRAQRDLPGMPPLAYSKATEKQLWVPLLEKAYAKGACENSTRPKARGLKWRELCGCRGRPPVSPLALTVRVCAIDSARLVQGHPRRVDRGGAVGPHGFPHGEHFVQRAILRLRDHVGAPAVLPRAELPPGPHLQAVGRRASGQSCVLVIVSSLPPCAPRLATVPVLTWVLVWRCRDVRELTDVTVGEQKSMRDYFDPISGKNVPDPFFDYLTPGRQQAAGIVSEEARASKELPPGMTAEGTLRLVRVRNRA